MWQLAVFLLSSIGSAAADASALLLLLGFLPFGSHCPCQSRGQHGVPTGSRNGVEGGILIPHFLPLPDTAVYLPTFGDSRCLPDAPMFTIQNQVCHLEKREHWAFLLDLFSDLMGSLGSCARKSKAAIRMVVAESSTSIIRLPPQCKQFL